MRRLTPNEAPTVLSNGGSLNAEQQLDAHAASKRGINAILTLTIVLGGILFFTNVLPALDLDVRRMPLVQQYRSTQARLAEVYDRAQASILDPIEHSLTNTTASLWSSIKSWLFPDQDTKTYITIEEYNELQEKLSLLESKSEALNPKSETSSNIGQIQKTKTKIINNFIPSASASSLNINTLIIDLDALEQRVSALASNFDSFSKQVPTIFKLPPTNTVGMGPITLNYQHLNSETLTISGASTLSSTLAVLNDFTVDTSVFKVDTTNNRVGINTSSPEVAFEVVGAASVSGAFTVGGTLTVAGNIGIGTTSAPNQLTVIGSGSFTGQLKATRNPTLAHTGTWPSFTNFADSTVYINPSSPVADGNVIAYVSGSDPKFLVDSEGDIYGNNLILTGSTSTGTTTIAGDLSVEGNSTFGDASGDKVKFRGTILPYSLSSIPFSVKASASQTVDVFRVRDSNDNVLLTVDQGTGLLTASSGFNFALGGSTATVSYSRLGIGTTSHAGTINTFDDFLVSGGFEVNGSAAFDGFALFTATASLSGNFELTNSSALFGINAGNVINTMLEVGGTASISGTTTLRGITYTWPSADGSLNQFLRTNGSGALAWATAGVASNSLDFDEFVNSMTLDANLTINRGTGNYYIGIGQSPSTVFEVQGTASASYLLTGNTLQVGGYSSAAYSRFGTSTTGHSNYISASNDLLISGDLEVDGSISAQFASVSQMFVMNNTASASQFFKTNGSGTNQSMFSIGVGNGTERLSIFNNDNSPIFTIASGGNVGVGTTGPGRRLDVLHADSVPQLRLSQSGSVYSELFIDSAGDVRISATGGDIRILDENLWVCTGGACPAGAPTGTGHLIIEGNVGIGTTNPGTYKLRVEGDVAGNAFFYLSDARLKTDLQPMRGLGLDILRGLHGFKYFWKDSGQPGVGLIAQDVEQVLPEAVSTDAVTGFKSVNYGALTAPIIESIRELEDEIENLRQEIKELKTREPQTDRVGGYCSYDESE